LFSFLPGNGVCTSTLTVAVAFTLVTWWVGGVSIIEPGGVFCKTTPDKDTETADKT